MRRGAWLVQTSHKEPSLATTSPATAGLICTEVSTTNLQSTLTPNVICELIFIILYIKTDTLCYTERGSADACTQSKVSLSNAYILLFWHEGEQLLALWMNSWLFVYM